MRKLSIISILASLLFVNCTKNLSSLNNDPKHLTSPSADPLFTQGELSLANLVTTTSVADAPFRVLSQEWTENQYTYEANYNFSAYDAPGGFWTKLYVNVIHNLEQAKQAYAAAVLPPAQQRNSIIISDLLEVYAYHMLVATYGDIPYTEAENTAKPFPAYDNQKTVYADLLHRVDTCIAGLSGSSGAAMGSADLIYGGDVPSWLKFAASLQLKMAIFLADVDPTTATSEINAAITTGVFTSNSDNALFQFDVSNPAYSNPNWNALQFSGRHDFGPTNFLINTMVGWNDPRLPFYFTNFPAGSTTYKGLVPGATNGYGPYSDFAGGFDNPTGLYDPALPGDLLDYSQVEFYLAEASARGIISDLPATHYNNAITASVEFWGGSAGDAASYLAQPSVAYGTAAGPWQQKIGFQEWIADYNNNWDSWTVIRRIHNPDVNTLNPPVSPASGYPIRFTYPPNETTSNSVNTAAAVADLPGGLDVVTAKLFWEN
jgi:Starch-binding associating with outer membrane